MLSLNNTCNIIYYQTYQVEVVLVNDFMNFLQSWLLQLSLYVKCTYMLKSKIQLRMEKISNVNSTYIL
jgi:hypothetical protein